MTWSYSGDPSSSQLDEVRFLLGDTLTDDQLVSNEEVSYAISKAGNSHAAAADLARAIGARYARLINTSSDGMSTDFAGKSRQMYELADRLDREAGHNITALPYAGGTSLADMDATKQDVDRPRSMMDEVNVAETHDASIGSV